MAVNALASVPEWLGGATVAALLAALGYLARMVMEAIGKARARTEERLARLAELRSILQAGRLTFKVQSANRGTLKAMIEQRMPELRKREQIEGFEDLFATAYREMEPRERELHGIIRGMTIHAIKPMNDVLQSWLSSDRYFKALPVSQRLQSDIGKLRANEMLEGIPIEEQVAAALGQLEAHLYQWRAKYETWIPDHPEHALIYLQDEKGHGVGFPYALEGLVDRLIQKSRKRSRGSADFTTTRPPGLHRAGSDPEPTRTALRRRP